MAFGRKGTEVFLAVFFGQDDAELIGRSRALLARFRALLALARRESERVSERSGTIVENAMRRATGMSPRAGASTKIG